MVFGKNSSATLAIDLGTEAVRVVSVDVKRGHPVLNLFAEQTLQEGALDTLPARHLSALTQIAATHRLSNRHVVAAMPTNLITTRTVQVDKSKPQSPEEQITWTLQNCLPFDPKDVAFDYWPISEGQNGRTTEVLVVATQSSVVQTYLEGFEKLAFDCAHLDVAPCALASLIQKTAENPDSVVGTIALTRNVGFFAIAEKGRILFWRPFEFNLANARSGVMIAGVQGNLDRVGDEISKCVSHMVGAVHIDHLSELQIYGHGADDMVVTEYLKNRFHLNVRNPSPFEALNAPADTASTKAATHYCTAVGLAVQDFAGAANG